MNKYLPPEEHVIDITLGYIDGGKHKGLNYASSFKVQLIPAFAEILLHKVENGDLRYDIELIDIDREAQKEKHKVYWFGGQDASGKAAGEIDMFELLTAALRQRPQYMMVGEVRGSEAYVVFQAMATGKSAYTTFHAESVQAMVHRMEQPPIEVPRALIGALNLVLIQAQVKVGTQMTRRVKSLTEIVGIDTETNELITNAVYIWNPADDTFNYSGHSYIYEQIAAAKGWSLREMMREVKGRTRLLTYLRKNNVSYKNVARYVSSFGLDASAVFITAIP